MVPSESTRATRPWSQMAVVATALLVLLGLLPLPPARADEVVDRGFEDETWTEGLIDLRSLDLSRTELVTNGFAGGGLNVKIPTGGFRGLGPFDRLEPAPKQAWFRYHIRLTNWNAASTGKLPGLAGIYSSSARGCIPPTAESPGWSARGMFGPPGTQGASSGEIPIGTYLYHADQEGSCGDGLWWGAGLEQGRWHCVEGTVKMNTPGQADGLIRGWLDGTEELHAGGIRFLREGEDALGVRHMWHNVYFGGSYPTPNPLSLIYDEVVVSTDGRIGCLKPFTDLDETVHAHSIEELHALGYLHGCDYRQACPLRELSRGEAAAFISRILDLPTSSRDYFSDDNGSTFEGVINRLAEARITLGCAPGRFCPDRTMTRAEFVTMLGRALDLKGTAPDAFSDDDGHWAESDIDRFAELELTKGCAPNRFCPDHPLPRDEAASFLVRSLSLLEPLNLAGVSPPTEWPPSGDPPPIPEEERD